MAERIKAVILVLVLLGIVAGQQLVVWQVSRELEGNRAIGRDLQEKLDETRTNSVANRRMIERIDREIKALLAAKEQRR